MIKKLLTLLTAGILAVSMSITAWADVVPPQSSISLDFADYGQIWTYVDPEHTYRNSQILVNGTVVYNQWVQKKSADTDWIYWYYYDSNGQLLINGTAPDGYKTNEFGMWDGCEAYHEQMKPANPYPDKIYRTSQEGANIGFWFDEEGLPIYEPETHLGVNCTILDTQVGTFRFPSSQTNVNPVDHYVLVYGATRTVADNEKFQEAFPFTVLGDPIRYNLEYDKAYSLDFTGNNMTADELSRFCLENDIIINISVIDENAASDAIRTGFETNVYYANPASVKTGEIG